MKKLYIESLIIIILFCTYIFPTGLFNLPTSVPKFIFICSAFVLKFLYNIYNKSFKLNDVVFIIILGILAIISNNINFLTFFPLILVQDVIDEKDKVKEYIKSSSILYICLCFTVIYSILFFGYSDRYAFTAIKEINQSGLAIFFLALMLNIKNRKIGVITMAFGLLTFSRSYYLAVILFLLSKIKILKKTFTNKKIINFCNYMNLTIISSIILILLGIFYLNEYKNGNIFWGDEISNRLFNLLDYSNFFRFIAIINIVLIIKYFPSKMIFGITDFDFKIIVKEISLDLSIPYKYVTPHNLFFSHLKMYGLFSIYEVFFVSNKLKQLITTDNFFIYIAIAAYSFILGAGLYSYWLFLAIFTFIINGGKNENIIY